MPPAPTPPPAHILRAGNPPDTLDRLRTGALTGATRLDLRGHQLTQLPPEVFSLADTLDVLDLSGNALQSLPEALGRRPKLQKLMLAGNRLRALPASIANCRQLELLRLAANQFDSSADALPAGLLALPRLAWLAHAGNPFSQALEQQAEQRSPAPPIAWSALQWQGLLGEGASGLIHAAQWQPAQGPAQAVAVKLFMGAVTSDGLPRSEMAACMAAGAHPQLVGALGRLVGHPDGTPGLVLRRIPAGHGNLAGPPSLASCSRDVYPAGWRLEPTAALAIAQGMREALAHLHRQGLAHGDLYAHNILADASGQALLGDFGAASFFPVDDPARRAALQRIDQRALGVLLGELALHCSDAATRSALRAEAAKLT